MKRVLIESPYAGDVARNLEYVRVCMRDSIMRGEAYETIEDAQKAAEEGLERILRAALGEMV